MADVSRKDLGEHEVRLIGAPLRSIGLKEVHHSVGGVPCHHPSLESESPTDLHGCQDPIVPTIEGKQLGKNPPAFGPG